MIPTFLCIDAEPDESSPQKGRRPWSGFASLVEFWDGLRRPLGERSGVAPRPTWFFRFDPVIEECYGRPDFVVHNHPATVDRLLEVGDPLAIHVHAQRWDHERGHVFSDHTDLEWGAYSVKFAANVFEETFGAPPARGSLGARFTPESMVDAFVDVGVRVDLSVEPGLEPIADDRTFGHHTTAPSTDFRGYPRHPYRVSRRAIGVPAASAGDARPLVEIPRTTFDPEWALARFRRRLKMKALGLGTPVPLNLFDVWPSPATYWDLVGRAADESPLPYVALVMRSDPPSWPSNQIVRQLLTALVDHPLAERLAFVDPLSFADLPAGPPKGDNRKHWADAVAGAVRANPA